MNDFFDKRDQGNPVANTSHADIANSADENIAMGDGKASTQRDTNQYTIGSEGFPNSSADHIPAWLSADKSNTPSERSPIKSYLIIALIAFAASFIGGALGANDIGNSRVSSSRSGDNSPEITINKESKPVTERFAQVASKVQPSVVSIQTEGAFGGGSGSGVIYTEDGYIITNNHVVATARNASLEIRYFDGTSSTGEVVGSDPLSDIAVVKVNETGLKAASFAESSSLHVGDSVLAIGSPLGLDGTVTSGIISSLHREVTLGGLSGNSSLSDAIQTDAAINPGNSGGALVNMNGEVIGINTAIASLSTLGGAAGNIGVGFAIPMETATKVASKLMKGESPKQAYLGVSLQDTPNGVAIAGVTDNSPAKKAGIEVNDTITKFDGKTIKTARSLVTAVQSHEPGDEVKIEIERDGKEFQFNVTLGTPGK